ncbi:hypothetical protein K9N68_04015 [Kovacikia minuta CCNUW1]|uniref:hypothetical protein n=1 Tax=Kovacikia minuta TaxID=2931930 RepID=UPI001CCED8A2|nr:hypothetical protein [Kovacikia minuta]UBF27140.1 hypothetical protein K9N68_04015 [Kovacikia minuta CCNUW1]
MDNTTNQQAQELSAQDLATISGGAFVPDDYKYPAPGQVDHPVSDLDVSGLIDEKRKSYSEQYDGYPQPLPAEPKN